jgi:hypothetical protein
LLQGFRASCCFSKHKISAFNWQTQNITIIITKRTKTQNTHPQTQNENERGKRKWRERKQKQKQKRFVNKAVSSSKQLVLMHVTNAIQVMRGNNTRAPQAKDSSTSKKHF